MRSEFFFFLFWCGGRKDIVYPYDCDSVSHSVESQDRKETRHSCILTRLIEARAAVCGVWFVSEISINIYQNVLLYKSPGDDFLEKASTQKDQTPFQILKFST